jgi:hypothetical protein
MLIEFGKFSFVVEDTAGHLAVGTQGSPGDEREESDQIQEVGFHKD